MSKCWLSLVCLLYIMAAFVLLSYKDFTVSVSPDNNLFQFEKNQTTTMKVKSASERKELKQGKDMEQEDSDNEDERNDAAKAKTTAFTESDLSSEEEKDDEELKEARM